MISKSVFRILIQDIFLSLLFSCYTLAQTFSGYVYEGDVGSTTTPIEDVTVKLYVSNTEGSLGTESASTTTSSTGSYSLPLPALSYDYYNIVESDKSGYYSVGAQSGGGTVINDNQIQYDNLVHRFINTMTYYFLHFIHRYFILGHTFT
ncbi:hypothetical protein JW824_14220, partial [bacterium]|nr:hypothetical protein [bacterium]